MNATTEINVNAAQCVQKVMHLGYIRFHNVCSNTFVDLPWGIGGWVGGVIFMGILALMFILLLTMTIHLIREGF